MSYIKDGKLWEKLLSTVSVWFFLKIIVINVLTSRPKLLNFMVVHRIAADSFVAGPSVRHDNESIGTGSVEGPRPVE